MISVLGILFKLSLQEHKYFIYFGKLGREILKGEKTKVTLKFLLVASLPLQEQGKKVLLDLLFNPSMNYSLNTQT